MIENFACSRGASGSWCRTNSELQLGLSRFEGGQLSQLVLITGLNARRSQETREQSAISRPIQVSFQDLDQVAFGIDEIYL
jgi:hypothetical protein